MSRGGSFGGGKSSLGYLFESSGEETAKPPSGEDSSQKSMPIQSHSAPAAADAADKIQATSNNYSRPQGQNLGNFITVSSSSSIRFEIPCNFNWSSINFSLILIIIIFWLKGRPSTKVQSVPGGSSSLGYLFGEHKQGWFGVVPFAKHSRVQ